MRCYFLAEQWDDHPDLDGIDKYLLMLIERASRAEPADCLTATQEEIGARLGRSGQNVRARMKRLVEIGAIRTTMAGRVGLAIQLVRGD